ncbi:MBL fold metallo-hydrolase [Desulfoluna sp.]|uniref:MBL fold metallo-hydrolase n=1 Tax=Desulfoluna sp. TaxID=2045199 RepID=UPI00262A0227|nr:MBL fold metallo-hydrolase [Desulfoluna sp.]
MARITLLGTGTCVPSLSRSACAALVQTETETLLIDSGPGTMRRLLEVGVSIDDLTGIFFTHIHPDHTAELVPLLFATQYPECRRTRPLQIYGGKGFGAFFEKLKGVYGGWIDPGPGLVSLTELSVAGRDLFHHGDLAVLTGPVVHRPESLACRVVFSWGRSVVFSGDTGPSEDLVALAQGADLFVCECSTPDGEAVPHHLTPSLAGEMAKTAQVGTLVLTHFYPACDKVDIEKECRRTYDGQLVLGEDLKSFDL